MKKILRHKKTSLNFDIAPLLDIMFMLLLFFLLTSSFLSPSISLKLPDASNKDVDEHQDIVVSVTDSNQIYINREIIADEDFANRIKSIVAKSEHKRVIFKGDEKIIYKKFVSILDSIKSSGAKEISIAHDVE